MRRIKKLVPKTALYIASLITLAKALRGGVSHGAPAWRDLRHATLRRDAMRTQADGQIFGYEHVNLMENIWQNNQLFRSDPPGF